MDTGSVPIHVKSHTLHEEHLLCTGTYSDLFSDFFDYSQPHNVLIFYANRRPLNTMFFNNRIHSIYYKCFLLFLFIRLNFRVDRCCCRHTGDSIMHSHKSRSAKSVSGLFLLLPLGQLSFQCIHLLTLMLTEIFFSLYGSHQSCLYIHA